MKNAVVAAAPTLPGLLPDVETRRLAESFEIETEGFNKHTIDRFPTMVEREILSKRFSELERALAPISRDLPAFAPDGTRTSDRRLAAQALGKMFMGWGIATGRDAGDKVAAFIEHLGEHPLFAVEAACRDATGRRLRKPNGEPLDFTFPPPSTALGAAAARHAGDLYEERFRIDKVIYTKKLTPPEPTAEQRDRIRTGLIDVSNKLRVTAAIEDDAEAARRAERVRMKNEREHRDRERAWIALGYEPKFNSDGSLTSPSTLKAVGRWPVPGSVKIKKAAAR